jgi:hypothetical protein
MTMKALTMKFFMLPFSKHLPLLKNEVTALLESHNP